MNPQSERSTTSASAPDPIASSRVPSSVGNGGLVELADDVDDQHVAVQALDGGSKRKGHLRGSP